MTRKNLIVGGALALAIATLLMMPAWLDAAEPAEDSTSGEKSATRGFLGVGLRELTPELQSHFGAPAGSGVLVASLNADSPAVAAGIRVGDVITSVDALPVASPRELSREIRHRPGESVTIELFRDGEARRLTATLGERRAHTWHHGGSSPEQWAELAEHWERWGEEFGEQWGQWGEEFGQRFGQEFRRKWGEEQGEQWERLAEQMAEHGEGWEEMGEEIGRTVEKALGEVDWEQIGEAVGRSMQSLDEIDWEEMGERIERRMEEMERRIEGQSGSGGNSG